MKRKRRKAVDVCRTRVISVTPTGQSDLSRRIGSLDELDVPVNRSTSVMTPQGRREPASFDMSSTESLIDMDNSTPPWMQELCHRLVINDPSLKNLCLNVRRFDEPMTMRLAVALEKNSVLETLNLTSAFVHDPQLFSVLAGRGLCDHRCLKVLHVSYNRLESLSTVATLLIGQTLLTSLHLDHNYIDSSAAVELAQSLEKNNSLEALHLCSNKITDDGCIALAHALRTNRTLRRLDLSNNAITRMGANKLLEALERHNYSILRLDLGKNGLPTDLTSRVDLICRANQSQRMLLLQGCIPSYLWSRILTGKDVELVCYLLRSKPDLAAQKGRKRCLDEFIATDSPIR